ncbi:TIGR03668 family PPOX class F420-dependent oxidoreductase [Micromonospora globispora]|uniref:TIGR03668 family PPOX class F420-dependent oxidoreductase n=1 Tax=Micromonospora globispora TaxID=1450148 RepID=A0A317K7Y1_9ACTN|nr:TIGR03668 family PPOX class F420-dependent oxidoreductase [Micromonospora globispora]PWU48538.1 TIGR03668 family PPOX class F420-dependent oxidoreductase [Micromonospora globispora]PWU55155.1 TIGR03668 family PPOX class F420-dependent oxidoreductase [Micromonospora globispora]RQW99820.1 TIGR03668 family PPOX class F420-dependent oxidoreductase [Micromonospora globispora]
MPGEELRQRVGSARAARLATVDPDGRPHLVPVCFVLLGDVVYHAVDEKPKRHRRLRRLANIQATGRACLLIDEYDEDWSKLWWVRLDGHGRQVEDPAEEAAARAALAAKYPQYVERPPGGPVVAVTVTHWSAWSAAQGSPDPGR